MKATLNFESTTDLINFIDHDSMSEVLISARSGSLEGANAISDVLQSLALYITPEKFWKEFNPAITGMFFDIGLACSGIPECWLQPQDAFNRGSFVSTDPDEEKPIIKIGINSTTPSNYSRESSIEKGAVVAVLAYLLEHSGRSVSIVQYCSAQKNNNTLLGSVILKNAEDLLDMDLLSFWLASPDSFNKCWNRALESLSSAQSNGNYIYNLPEYGEKESDIFLQAISKEKLWTRKDSIDWILSNLTKVGINFSIN